MLVQTYHEFSVNSLDSAIDMLQEIAVRISPESEMDVKLGMMPFYCCVMRKGLELTFVFARHFYI